MVMKFPPKLWVECTAFLMFFPLEVVTLGICHLQNDGQSRPHFIIKNNLRPYIFNTLGIVLKWHFYLKEKIQWFYIHNEGLGKGEYNLKRNTLIY